MIDTDPLGAPPPIAYGGPEALFGITGLRVDGDRAFGTMDLRRMRIGGAPGLGTLGVLVDDVMGYAMVISRPKDHWAVSTEITVDVVGPLEEATTARAEARAVQTDAHGSFAQGEVRDQDGRLIAVCSQRGRFVALTPNDPAVALPPPGDGASTDLAETIGAQWRDDVSRLEFASSTPLQNNIGILHGGVSLAASELAAVAALDAADLPGLRPHSLRIAYVRSGTAGTTMAFTPEVRYRGRSLAVIDVTGSVVNGDPGKASTIAQVIAHPASR